MFRWFLFLSCCFSFLNAQEKINFEDHILPIFKNNCFDCHNPDKSKADYSLTTFEDAIKGGETGPAVIPKKPDESLLYRLVIRKEKPYMPRKEPKMDDSKIKLIRLWIQQGLLKSAGASVIKQKKSKTKISALKPSKGKPKVALKMPKMISLEPIFRTKQTGQLLAQASNPWSPLMAFSVGNQVLLYDVNKLLLRGVLKYPEGMAYQLRFSRDGKFLLGSGGVAGQKGNYILWRVEDGEIIRQGGQEYDSILSGDISQNLKYVGTGGSSKFVKIYELSTGKILHKLKKHNDWVLATEFSPDGVLLASADRNGGIVVWESKSGQQYCELNGHKSAVNALSWRADSNFLVSGSEDGNIKIWSLHRRRQIKNWRGHNGGVLWVEYGQDGKIVSCGRDKLLKIWDRNGKLIKTIKHFKDLPLRASFSSDRRFVIAGDFRGEAVVFNAKSGKLRNRMALNPPSVKEQLKNNSKQVGAIKNRLTKKINEQGKHQKNVVSVQSMINKKKNELKGLKKKPVPSEKGKVGDQKLNPAEKKKKIAGLQKELKTFNTRLKPMLKKRNELNKQAKYLKWKQQELIRQDYYWQSALLINEINEIKSTIDGFEDQITQFQTDLKDKEARWQLLKKDDEQKALFLKTGQKELSRLKVETKKGKAQYSKNLKLISTDLKERGKLNSELYEATFMKNELKVDGANDEKILTKIRSLTLKLKTLNAKIEKSKAVLLKLKKANSNKTSQLNKLNKKLKVAPGELSKIKNEMKILSQQLSTPNPLSKSLPEKIKLKKSKYDLLVIKFNTLFSKFEK